MINNQKTFNVTKFTSSLVADDFITTYPYLSFLNILFFLSYLAFQIALIDVIVECLVIVRGPRKEFRRVK